MTREKYEVGYGKPPKQSQFQPGQSGNPNGRPLHASTESMNARFDDTCRWRGWRQTSSSQSLKAELPLS